MFSNKSVRFELAPTVLVDALARYVERVLEALRQPEALVTDLSVIADFSPDDGVRAAASAELGVSMKSGDYVYEVAQRLRDKA